ncbi:hypothetical protein V8G54_017948 [Vigna mungo]|uniref:Uncharacterized protein n=1 Tax=Vigna mungo TaxID=3915 RepID=A0AAQ3N808_VIGMU
MLIGNPLMEFDTDLNSKAEFLWSHGLISDSTYDLFTRVCNYSTIRRQMISRNLSEICENINTLVFTEVSNYIDQYDVTLDVCLSSVGGWTQVYGNILSYATIRGASHEAPFSQPKRSLRLLKAFLEGKPLPVK